MAKTKACSDQKALLLSSLAQFLERSGFSKTLKKFHSEAQFEKDGIKGSLPDLEEVFKAYLESCNHNQNVNTQTEQVKPTDNLSKADGEDDSVVIVESNNIVKEKKKKKSKVLPESLGDDVGNQLEQESKGASKSASKSEKEKKSKDKKKKKDNVTSDSLEDNTEEKDDIKASKVDGASKSEKVKKSKDKKKKKDNVTSDSLVDNTEEKDDIKTSKVDSAIQETKASKKRKRVEPEENCTQLADNKTVDETDANNVKENKSEGSQLGLKDTEKTPMKTNDGQENGNVEKNTEKKSKKQRIGSAEPTSMKAFQRIKLDEVVFTDERLQDNSYWAKGGAETGYGAKAQEVLGQVRGRGFRHEKTKKKRGSYRGGQIDQQSHSVKFNYSDEE